jgi:ethanolamine kinase
MKEPRIAAKIAKELQKFHQVDIPGSKEPELWNDIFKFLKKGTDLCFFDWLLFMLLEFETGKNVSEI